MGGWCRNAKVLAAGVRRAATLLLAAGTVWAASVRCEGGYFDPCFGTGKDDEIRGTATGNQVFARGGSDVVRLGGGGGGQDWVAGDQKRPSYKYPANQGDDTVHGGRGRDLLNGDSLVRNRGNDTPRGGRGDDELDGNVGEDRLYGGGGDDRFVEGQDGAEDHLFCGEGHDTYTLPDPPDASDRVSASCEERLTFPTPEEPYGPHPMPPDGFIYD
jgi:Ca2+-binding RTX toxin-like protein